MWVCPKMCEFIIIAIIVSLLLFLIIFLLFLSVLLVLLEESNVGDTDGNDDFLIHWIPDPRAARFVEDWALCRCSVRQFLRFFSV